MNQSSRGIKGILVAFLSIIGALSVVLVLIGAIILIVSVVTKDRVPAKTILELNLEQGVIEYVPDDPVASAVFSQQLTVRDIVDALKRAEDDDRVLGLIARVGTGSIGLAHAQEIRDAVIAFRESGKPAYVFSETFGEFGPGITHYYIATAFDEIFMQPSGDVGLIGLLFETPFIKGTLDKLGIDPQMDHRYEYKNAKNIITEEKFTPAHKEATAAVMESMFNQLVRDISQARQINESEVRTLFDRGPFLGNEAVDFNLIDNVLYWDELYDKLRTEVGEDARLLYVSRYLARAGRPYKRGETIALIYGVGGVQRGKSGFDPLFFDLTMGSETVARAFRDAVEDKNVKAIIFRIDSPGGSYVASDAIWRETIRANEAGKPVIASMSNVAGSGGYFVAMGADKIIAQPGTITGSIGVLGGKFVTNDLWNKIGISWDYIETSKSSTMWSGLKEYTPEQWERFQAFLDRIYDDFTAKAAEGRGMTQDEIHNLAKGRIWTGEDAKMLGLIDELGGFDVAIELAREAAGIDPAKDIRIKLIPPKRSFIDVLLDKGPDSSEPGAIISSFIRIQQSLQPLLNVIRRSGLINEDDILTMPGVEIVY